MPRRTLKDWLEERSPSVPGPFLLHLLEAGSLDPCTAKELGRVGGDALSRALGSPGRNREAAFALLAGDAFLTYACEALTEEDGEVGPCLEGLIQRMGARFP
jgi:hypothetical protein